MIKDFDRFLDNLKPETLAAVLVDLQTNEMENAGWCIDRPVWIRKVAKAMRDKVGKVEAIGLVGACLADK